jgi:hypothetical protein
LGPLLGLVGCSCPGVFDDRVLFLPLGFGRFGFLWRFGWLRWENKGHTIGVDLSEFLFSFSGWKVCEGVTVFFDKLVLRGCSNRGGIESAAGMFIID